MTTMTMTEAPRTTGQTLRSTVRRAARRPLATTPSRGALVARAGLAALLFPHGAQHALGWLGGYGFGSTHNWMTGTLGFPGWAATLAIVTELVAPFALLLGLAGRVAALGVVGLMLGALSTHAPNGFFMNWFAALPAGAEGFEYHLVVITLALVVVVEGSGAASLDGRLGRPRASENGGRS